MSGSPWDFVPAIDCRQVEVKMSKEVVVVEDRNWDVLCDALLVWLEKYFADNGVDTIEQSEVLSVDDGVTGAIEDREVIGELFMRLGSSGKLTPLGDGKWKMGGGSTEEPKDEGKAERALTLVEELNRSIQVKFYYMGEALRDVFLHEYWKAKGYKSFDDYCDGEVALKRRMARYLIKVYEVFSELNKQLPDAGVETKLQMMGITKAIEICGVVTADNFDYWSTLACQVPVKELHGKVNAATPSQQPSTKAESKVEEPVERMTRMTFVLSDTQLANVNAALDILREETKSDKTGHLLDVAATLIMSHYGDAATASVLIQHLERWGLKIVAFGQDGECIHGAELLEQVQLA